MMRKELLAAVFFLVLVGTFLDNALRLGNVTVSATPLLPFIMIIPEQTKNTTITPGMNYTIAIYTDYDGSDIQSWTFDLAFDPEILEGVEVRNGDLITTEEYPQALFIWGVFDNVKGTLSGSTGFFLPLPPDVPTATGPGTFAYVTFRVVGTGISNIALGSSTSIILYDSTPPESFPVLIDAALPPGATQPPYGSDHIGHGYFDNIPNVHDLAVSKLVTAATAIPGDIVSINVTVRNEGNFTENFDVTVYTNTSLVDTQSTSLTRGAKTTLTFYWNTAGVLAGNYIVNATALLPEDIDLSDNSKTAEIEVRSIHDVAIFSLEIPAEVIIGDIAVINVTVENQGNIEENVTLTVSYKQEAPFEPPAVVFNTTSFILAARPANHTVSVDWNTTGLDRQFGYTINATATIPQDEDLSDNNQARTIILRLGHDVSITAISASSLAALPGETVIISVTVKNTGGFNETMIEVKVSYDSTPIGSQQILSLPEGNSTTLAFDWNTAGIAPKLYAVTAEAVLDTDANPTNNQRLLFITVLTPTGHIAGTVRDPSGNPIQGANVTANGHYDITDTKGHYNITDIPVKTYTVTASKTGFYTSSHTNVVVVAKQTRSLDFTLTATPTTGHIAGTVKDTSGYPIQGANVTANGHYDITDTEGRYNITDLPPETYTVTASKNGYETASHTDITVTPGQTTITNFEMTPTQTPDILPYIIAAIIIASLIGIAGIAIFLRKSKGKRSNETPTS